VTDEASPLQQDCSGEAAVPQALVHGDGGMRNPAAGDCRPSVAVAPHAAASNVDEELRRCRHCDRFGSPGCSTSRAIPDPSTLWRR
jgi:hypothetical protein